VAPNCHLIGARIGAAAMDVDIADVYLWLGGFLNGSPLPGFPTVPPPRAADVISSSWGQDGVPLSSTMRDCLDFLTTYGRAGKGCVLCFSLPNAGYIDFTDATAANHRAWATYEKTIAIGASISTNPTSPVDSADPDPNGNTSRIVTAVDRRALFSPYGNWQLWKPDLVAPSNTAYKTVQIDLGDGRVVDARTAWTPSFPAYASARAPSTAAPGAQFAMTMTGTSRAPVIRRPPSPVPSH
jgi:hypothetical protein